jgi:hypothetical protein
MTPALYALELAASRARTAVLMDAARVEYLAATAPRAHTGWPRRKRQGIEIDPPSRLRHPEPVAMPREPQPTLPRYGARHVVRAADWAERMALTCAVCGEPFPRANPTGRAPRYCPEHRREQDRAQNRASRAASRAGAGAA